jgi:ABC-type branched-subunit amino acid transport system substrate-binding protein
MTKMISGLRCAAAIFGILLLPSLACAELTVVQVAPFSGPLADTGKLVQQGLQLAIQDANNKGGVAGQKIRLISKDDGYKVEETVRLVRESAADKPVALIGLVGTGNLAALQQGKVLDELGVPLIGVRTGASDLRWPTHPLVFHLRASYAAEVDKLVEVASSVGGSRFGVMYQNDAFGEDGFAALKKSLATRKLVLQATGSYEKNTTKVDAAVNAMLAAKELTSIILVANSKATAAFVSAYREKGGLASIYAVSVNNDREIVASIGTEKAHGLAIAQVVPFPTSGVLPLTREYQATLKRYAPGAEPTVSSLEGYVYGRVLVEAIRRAAPKSDRAALVRALESAPFELGGFVINLTPNRHEGSQFVELTMIGKSGALIR